MFDAHRRLAAVAALALGLALAGCGEGNKTDQAQDVTPTSSTSLGITLAPPSGTATPPSSAGPGASTGPTRTQRPSRSPRGTVEPTSTASTASTASTETGPMPPSHPSTKDPSSRPSKSPTKPPKHPPEPTSGPKRLAWVPFGPASPSAPTATARHYDAFYKTCSYRQEDQIEPAEEAFWRAAFQICNAVRSGSDAQWRTAIGLWNSGAKGFSADGCLLRTVRSMLTAIMGQTPDPAQRPTVVLGSSAPGYACTPTNPNLDPRRGPQGQTADVTATWSGAGWIGEMGRWTLGEREIGAGTSGSGSMRLSLPDDLTGAHRLLLTFDTGQKVDFGTFTYE